MERRWVTAWGLLLIVQCQVHAEPANQPERPRIALMFCDKVGLDETSRTTIRKEVVRIFKHAAVDVTWGEAVGGLDSPTSFDLGSAENCRLPSSDFFFHYMIVLSREETRRAPLNALGFAQARLSRRVYVLYGRVRDAVERHVPPGKQREDSATLLGNVIAHELGHLLLPGEGHSSGGIMTATWDYSQIQDAIAGTLLFQPNQVRRIQANLNRYIAAMLR